MKWNVVIDGKIAGTIEAPHRVSALSQARKEYGWYFDLEEVREKLIPGEAEYSRFLDWQRAENARRREARTEDHDIFRIIATGEVEESTTTPYPLTDEETEAAGKYARFLGERIYRQFLAELSLRN